MVVSELMKMLKEMNKDDEIAIWDGTEFKELDDCWDYGVNGFNGVVIELGEYAGEGLEDNNE